MEDIVTSPVSGIRDGSEILIENMSGSLDEEDTCDQIDEDIASHTTSKSTSQDSRLLDEVSEDVGEENEEGEVFRMEQFVINDTEPLPPAAPEGNDSPCDALRTLGALIGMTNFETDPLEYWFLTRVLDVISEARTKGYSERLQKTTVAWLGFVLHRIVNTNISRDALFEEIKSLLLESIRIFVKSNNSLPTPLKIFELREAPPLRKPTPESNHHEKLPEPHKEKFLGKSELSVSKSDVSKKKGDKGPPAKGKDPEVISESVEKQLEFLTTWIYLIFAASSTFDSVRLLMPLRKLTCAGKG